MFASLKLNALFSMVIMGGCVVSAPFAASVIAGALGTCFAAVVIFGVYGDPNHPVSLVFQAMRRSYNHLYARLTA